MYFEGSTVAHLDQGGAVKLLVAVFHITRDEKIVKKLIERLEDPEIHPGVKFGIELSLEKLAKSGSQKAGEYLKEKKSNTIDVPKVYQWVKSNIHPKTGLVKSFPAVPEQDASYGVTWMYNQAQAIQDALAVGDLSTAEQLARSALRLKRNKGAWYSGYLTDSGEVAARIKEQNLSWVGPNMALGHSLLHVLEYTSDQKLSEEIVKVALGLTSWLEGYYFDKGKYAYVSGGEGLDEVWTEHNERAFAFYYQLYNQFNNLQQKNKIVLAKYKNGVDVQGFKLRADKIIRWIQTDKKEGGMWDGDHYLVGYKDVEGKELIPEIIASLPGDHPDYRNRHAWGYPQYLGPIMASIAGLNPKDFAGGMDWLLAHLSQVEINGKIFKGVPRWLGTPSIWAKGTSETVVALQLLRRENEAKILLPTLAALQTENGGILAAVGDSSYGWPIHFPYESYEGISGVLVGAGQFGPEFIADLELVKPPSDVKRNNAIAQREENLSDTFTPLSDVKRPMRHEMRNTSGENASSPVAIRHQLIGAITALSLLWGTVVPSANALEMSLWKKFDEPTERARMINEIALGIINLGDEQTGLAPSHVGHPGFEKLKFVYDAAVDALVLKAAGKQKDAEKILDYFADRLAIPIEEVAPYADTNGIAGILKVWKTDSFNVRGLINALDRTSTKPRGQGMLEYYSTPGPMSFIVMGFLNVNKERYLPVAVELGNALLSLQRPNGGLKDGDRSPNRVHIEPHMDSFATFLQLYQATNDKKWKMAAEKAWQFFIKSDAYHPSDGIIWQGIWEFGTNKTFATDTYSWTMAGPGGDRMSLFELEKFTETMLSKSLTSVTLELPDGKTRTVVLVDFTDPKDPQTIKEREGFHPMGTVEWAGGVIAALQKNAVKFWEKGNPQQKEMARHYKALAEYLIANSLYAFYEIPGLEGMLSFYATGQNVQTGHGWRTPFFYVKGPGVTIKGGSLVSAWPVLPIQGLNPFEPRDTYKKSYDMIPLSVEDKERAIRFVALSVVNRSFKEAVPTRAIDAATQIVEPGNYNFQMWNAFVRGDYRKSMEWAQKVVNDPDWIRLARRDQEQKAREIGGIVHYPWGNAPSNVPDLEAAIWRYPFLNEAAAAMWGLAAAHFELGNREESKKWIRRIIEEVPYHQIYAPDGPGYWNALISWEFNPGNVHVNST